MRSGRGASGDFGVASSSAGPHDKILLLLRHGETHMNVFLRDHPDEGDGML